MPILDEEDGAVTRVRPLARAALGSSGCIRLLQHLFYLDDLMELLLLGTSGSGLAVTKGIATRMSQRRWGLNRGILLES